MEHVLSLSDIREQKATLSRAVNEAQAQLADLEVAERIVIRFGQAMEDDSPSHGEMGDFLGPVAPKTNAVNTSTDAGRAVTTKALMLVVLRQSPQPWVTSEELRERVSALKGEDVPMGTVGPTLSNLKNERVIVRNGFKVALAERVDENGPQNGSPP